MPFLDDAGIRFEEHRGPVWSAFAHIGDQVERFVALNIAWALTLAPGVLAFAFPEWPMWLRVLFGLASLAALIPATGALYGVVAAASQGEYIGVEVVRQELRAMAAPAMRSLAPLFGAFGTLAWSTFVAVTMPVPVLDVLLVFALLVVSVVAISWGPLVADEPDLPAWTVLRRSIDLAWRQPGITMLQYAVIAVTVVIGIVSIGGLVLIVPVAVALLQTQLYRHVAHPDPDLTTSRSKSE